MNAEVVSGALGPEGAVLVVLGEILEAGRMELDRLALTLKAISGQEGPARRGDPPPGAVRDDREALEDGGPAVLVVEDDLDFATILRSHCRARGLACLVAASGEEGLRLARRYRPLGIILELTLSRGDGWRVLDALEADEATRGIPVHLMSVRAPAPGSFSGAAELPRRGHLAPEDLDQALRTIEALSAQTVQRLLIIENDGEQRRRLAALLSARGLAFDEASSSMEDLQVAVRDRHDCAIVDLGLWDLAGDQLLRTLSRQGLDRPPVLLCTAGDPGCA